MSRICGVSGCVEVRSKNAQSNYCQNHQKKKCVIDDCKNMVATWSKSGCCYEHRTIGRKLKWVGS